MFLDKFQNKSRGGFRKWTFLKMSKIEKSNKVLKKTLLVELSEHNALIFKKNAEKFVIVFFKKTVDINTMFHHLGNIGNNLSNKFLCYYAHYICVYLIYVIVFT